LLIRQSDTVVAAPVVVVIRSTQGFVPPSLLFARSPLIVVIALPITRLLGPSPLFFLAALLIAPLLVASLLIVALASQVAGALVCLATLFFGLTTLQLQRALLVLLPLRIALALSLLTFLIESAAIFLFASFHFGAALLIFLLSPLFELPLLL
jgi:hypothetical protein